MAYAGFLRTLPAPASTLSGFVCLLDTTWFTQADANALDGTTFINGGGSLRLYTDATKTTQLPVDVVSFVTGGTPEVKVFTRLPSYASGSTLWVESDAGATTQPVSTSTYGSEAVWLDYDMFTLDGVTDRSGNKTLAPTSMATATSDSPVGGSVADFNGTSSWFSHTQTGTSTDTTPFTVKAWIKPVSATNQAGIVIAEAFNRNYGYGLRTDGTIRGELYYSGSSRNVDSTNTRTANAWNYTAYTYESDTQHNVYLNGVYSTDTYGGRHFRRDVDLRWGKQANYSSSGIRGWFDGEMSAMGVLKSNNELLKDDFDSEYANQNSPSTFGSSSGWTTGGGGPTYSLTLDAGAYVYTGSPVALAANRALTIDSGSYAYSGSAVSLSVGRAITLNAGTYAYTGNSAALKASRKISIDSGSYAYTGNAVTLTYTTSGGPTYQLTLDPGVYNYNGSDVPLAANRNLTIDSASYNYDGNDVSLSAGRAITLTPGSYSISGQDVSMRVSRAITIDAASYDYIGYPVALSYSGQIISLISGYSVEYKQDDITGGYKLDDVSADYEQDYINVRFL